MALLTRSASPIRPRRGAACSRRGGASLLVILAVLVGLPAAPLAAMPQASSSQPSPGQSARADYVIGARDLLVVQVVGEPTASGTTRVDADGTITLPLIGRVAASGKTLLQLAADVRKALADGFFTDPKVSITVQEYGSQKIFVLGEVRTPGSYPLSGETTLLAALALAGSTLPSAGDTVVINRPRHTAAAAEGGSDEYLRVNLRDLQSGLASSQNLRLQDGDTIFVPKVESVFVTGQVRNAGAFPYQEGLTVLQAVALAGGVNDRGSMSRIVIVRAVNGTRAEIKAKATDVVKPGDTVLVKERFF
jgi:polysaccharide export outer membrane protein